MTPPPLRRTRRWCGIALAASATLAAPLGAQAVVGFGSDATTLPGGTVRVDFLNDWTRFQQRFSASSGASILVDSHIRRTRLSVELGLSDRLMLRAMLPSTGALVTATYFPDTATAIHADSVNTFDRSGIGDGELSLKLVWLGAQPVLERTDPHGVHLRSSITAVVRFGTGSPARPTEQFGMGTGTGQMAYEARSTWDLLLGPHFWTTFRGVYGRPVADSRLVHVAPPGDPFAVAGPVYAHRALGDYYTLEATPRVGLGQYFSVGVQYRLSHNAMDHYTGTRDTTDAAGNPVVLDAAVLDSGSAVTTQELGGGFVYSSVADHARGRGALAFDLSLQYFRIVAITGNRPKTGTWVARARFYVSLWGRGSGTPVR